MLKIQTGLFVLIAALLGFAIPAESMEQPTAEYSADSHMETVDGVVEGKVYAAPGKERRETMMDGNKSIIIMRNDKKKMWMLMPEQKMYTEMKFGKSGRKDDLSNYKIEKTKVGSDTIDGVKTTKSKIIMTGPNGKKFGGFLWTTKEGIVMKMDAIAVDKNGKDRIKSELRNLKIGKQDPSLFEIPKGYSSMASMGGIGKMMMQSDEDSEDDKQPQKKEEKKGFGLKDAFDLLK